MSNPGLFAWIEVVFDEKYLFERNGTGRDIDVQAQRDLATTSFRWKTMPKYFGICRDSNSALVRQAW